MEAAYVEAGGSPVESVSDIGLRLKVLAGELYRAQCQAEWVLRQSFPETADGAQLERHGAQRGVLRGQAQRASGSITFTRYLPITFDLLVPKGTLCAASGEEAVEYETTEDAVLQAGTVAVTAPARAVEPGAKGNAAEGYINTLVTPVEGIQYASNRVHFTGGCDEEDEASYRARVAAAYKSPVVMGNAAYYEEIAREVPGVTSAQAVADGASPGTVNVYLWGEGAAPDADTLARAQAALESRKAVGAVLNVQAAKQKKVNLLLKVVLEDGFTFDDVAPAAEAALKAFLLKKQVGDAVPATQILQVAMAAVPQAKRMELPASMSNIAAVAGTIPVPGAVTVGALT